MQVTKGQRAVISVSGFEIEVFMLPNGEYRYSLESASQAVGKDRSDFGKYLQRTNPEAAVGSQLIAVGRTRVKGLTSAAVREYWHWKAENGNKEAKALVRSLTEEVLDRRADSAFGNTQTEEAYEEKTAQLRLELLNTLLAGTYQSVEERKQPGRFDLKFIDRPGGLSEEERLILLSADYIIMNEQCQAEPVGYQCADEVLEAAEQRLTHHGYHVKGRQLQPLAVL